MREQFYIHMTNNGHYWTLPGKTRVPAHLTYGPYTFEQLQAKLETLNFNSVNRVERVISDADKADDLQDGGPMHAHFLRGGN